MWHDVAAGLLRTGRPSTGATAPPLTASRPTNGGARTSSPPAALRAAAPARRRPARALPRRRPLQHGLGGAARKRVYPLGSSRLPLCPSGNAVPALPSFAVRRPARRLPFAVSYAVRGPVRRRRRLSLAPPERPAPPLNDRRRPPSVRCGPPSRRRCPRRPLVLAVRRVPAWLCVHAASQARRCARGWRRCARVGWIAVWRAARQGGHMPVGGLANLAFQSRPPGMQAGGHAACSHAACTHAWAPSTSGQRRAGGDRARPPRPLLPGRRLQTLHAAACTHAWSSGGRRQPSSSRLSCQCTYVLPEQPRRTRACRMHAGYAGYAGCLHAA